MIKKGWRFPLSLRLRRAVDGLEIGAVNLQSDAGNVALLSDFHPWPVGDLEQYEIQGLKTEKRGRRPQNMSELINCIGRKILFAEGVYGAEHGTPRRAAFDFPLDLSRSTPEYCDREFLEDVWGRMTADYMFNLMAGVRRLMPYLDKTAPVTALRKIALTPLKEEELFRASLLPCEWNPNAVSGRER